MATTIMSQIDTIITLVLSSSSPDRFVTPPPVAAPDTLKGVDDLIRTGFEAYRDSCFNWLLAATGLVVVGLVFEGPELWHEITSIIRHWRFTHRYEFSLPEDHTPNWAKLLAFPGWLLIVVGVAGEYVADSFVSKADGYVQQFDEILLSDAQRGSSLARERASAAYERAVTTEREAAEENRRASESLQAAEAARQKAEEARVKAEGLELQIAQANERAARAEEHAAEANRVAESERLARVAIEEKLAGWKLTGKQQADLFARVKRFPNTPYDLSVNTSETTFMELLDSVLTRAQWSRKLPKPPPSPNNALGINVLINNKAAQSILRGEVQIVIPDPLVKDFGKAASELAEGLFAAGINVKGHHVLQDNDPTAIHIVIGSR